MNVPAGCGAEGPEAAWTPDAGRREVGRGNDGAGKRAAWAASKARACRDGGHTHPVGSACPPRTTQTRFFTPGPLERG